MRIKEKHREQVQGFTWREFGMELEQNTLENAGTVQI